MFEFNWEMYLSFRLLIKSCILADLARYMFFTLSYFFSKFNSSYDKGRRFESWATRFSTFLSPIISLILLDKGGSDLSACCKMSIDKLLYFNS